MCVCVCVSVCESVKPAGQALTKPSRAKIRSKRFPIQDMLGLCYTFSTWHHTQSSLHGAVPRSLREPCFSVSLCLCLCFCLSVCLTPCLSVCASACLCLSLSRPDLLQVHGRNSLYCSLWVLSLHCSRYAYSCFCFLLVFSPSIND